MTLAIPENNVTGLGTVLGDALGQLWGNETLCLTHFLEAATHWACGCIPVAPPLHISILPVLVVLGA